MGAYAADDWKVASCPEQDGGSKDCAHKKNSARIKSMDLITSLNKIKLESQARNNRGECRRDI